MAVNSPQPTLLCVITLFVCLSCLYEQDSPFLNFVTLFVVVFVVPTRAFVGREVGRIWRLAMEPGIGQRLSEASEQKENHLHPPRPIGGNTW